MASKHKKEIYEKWNFLIPIVGTGKNMEEAFEDAVEASESQGILGYNDAKDCEPEFDCKVDENGEEF